MKNVHPCPGGMLIASPNKVQLSDQLLGLDHLPVHFLTYCVVHLASPYNHLHLEDVTLRNAGGYQVLQDRLLVEAEGAGQVGGGRAQQHLRHIVGAAGDHLPLQVPPVHACINSAVNRPYNCDYAPIRVSEPDP
jgi:hypothetical protein